MEQTVFVLSHHDIRQNSQLALGKFSSVQDSKNGGPHAHNVQNARELPRLPPARQVSAWLPSDRITKNGAFGCVINQQIHQTQCW